VVAQTGRTGQRLYDAGTGLSTRRAERKASPLSEIAGVLVRLDHVARFTRSVANLEGLSQRLKKAIL
jgi:hypothetical protein